MVSHPGADRQQEQGHHAEPEWVPRTARAVLGLGLRLLPRNVGRCQGDGGLIHRLAALLPIDALLTGPLQDLPEFFEKTDTPQGLTTLVGNLAFRIERLDLDVSGDQPVLNLDCAAIDLRDAIN